MSIRRISEKENYSITSGWLNDFADKITKEGNFLDRIQERRDFKPEEKFATIEEKMEDIKTRIGFSSSSDSISKSASEACDCENCDECKGNSHREGLLDGITYMLNFISKIMSDHPSMLPAQVLSKCRREIPNCESYESKVCPKKLNSFIESLRKPSEFKNFEYISDDALAESVSDEEDQEVLRGK